MAGESARVMGAVVGPAQRAEVSRRFRAKAGPTKHDSRSTLLLATPLADPSLLLGIGVRSRPAAPLHPFIPLNPTILHYLTLATKALLLPLDSTPSTLALVTLALTPMQPTPQHLAARLPATQQLTPTRRTRHHSTLDPMNRRTPHVQRFATAMAGHLEHDRAWRARSRVAQKATGTMRAAFGSRAGARLTARVRRRGWAMRRIPETKAVASVRFGDVGRGGGSLTRGASPGTRERGRIGGSGSVARGEELGSFGRIGDGAGGPLANAGEMEGSGTGRAGVNGDCATEVGEANAAVVGAGSELQGEAREEGLRGGCRDGRGWDSGLGVEGRGGGCEGGIGRG